MKKLVIVSKTKGVAYLLSEFVISYVLAVGYKWIQERYGFEIPEPFSIILLVLLCLPFFHGTSVFYKSFTQKKTN